MDARRLHDHDAQEDWYFAGRREKIRADLVTRLEKVCANFSDSDFRSLIDSMTDQKMRGERAAQ
jgi:hypothetical protein